MTTTSRLLSGAGLAGFLLLGGCLIVPLPAVVIGPVTTTTQPAAQTVPQPQPAGQTRPAGQGQSGTSPHPDWNYTDRDNSGGGSSRPDDDEIDDGGGDWD